MKVAMIAFDFGEYCIRLADALGDAAQVMLVLAHDEAAPYRPLLRRSVLLRTFAKPRLRQPFQQLQMVALISRYVREFGPDVIHLQAGHLWFNIGLPLLSNAPLVVTVHDAQRHVGDGAPWKTPQWVLDRGYRRATERIVHAPQVRDALLSRLRLSPDTVHVVPHVWLGDDGASPSSGDEDGTILFFGRLWEYKGLEYLIAAEPLISERVPHVKIVIAGTGRDFKHYRRLMADPSRFTVYNERVTDAKRSELFRRASVVVLPYVEASQSGVIPIASRFGKPVVATTVGGLPAMVDHGRTGMLVPPRDVPALASAIVALIENEVWRRELGENARERVNVECAPHSVASRTHEVYAKAIRRRADCSPLRTSQNARDR